MGFVESSFIFTNPQVNKIQPHKNTYINLIELKMSNVKM